MRFVIYFLLKASQISENLCSLQYDIRHWSTSTKPQVVSSKEDTGFTHTGVETASISAYKGLCIKRLHSQIIRNFKRQTSERVSQTFWPSYTRNLISSYYVRIRLLQSPSVYTNTPIHTHINSHTFLNFTNSPHRPVLPAAEICRILKLILIYVRLGYVKLSRGWLFVLNTILKWNKICSS
jgi:hypothetical protein